MALKMPTFLDDQEQYDHIRSLWATGRVLAIRGDLTADQTMLDLAEAFETVESPEDLASNVGDFGGVDPFTLTRGLTIARSIQELDPRIRAIGRAI